jgi:excisionase family DNA binding protein
MSTQPESLPLPPPRVGLPPVPDPANAALSEPLLTAEEVSAMLGGIPPSTILQWAREGRLPRLKLGRHVRFVRADVEQALSVHRSGPSRPRLV